MWDKPLLTLLKTYLQSHPFAPRASTCMLRVSELYASTQLTRLLLGFATFARNTPVKEVDTQPAKKPRTPDDNFQPGLI